MKKKIYIGIITATIIIIGLILICFIKKDNKPTNSTTASVTEQNEGIKNTGGVAYEDKQLTNFKFEIKDVTQEVTSKLKNANDFFLAMKRYAYEKGLITGDNATMQKFEQDGNELKMRFIINDENQTRIIAKVNLSNNKYEFYYYK